MNNFTITYKDNTLFEGSTINGDWKNVDDLKGIIQLEFILGDVKVIMKGYKQYNHFKERLGLQMNGISKIILMGRTDGNTKLIEFDFLTKKVNEISKPYGQEYGTQILSGWKEGMSDTPDTKFYKIKPNNIQ